MFTFFSDFDQNEANFLILYHKYVTQRLKMSPFSKKRIVHFIGFLNRAHQNEKSDILHVPIFKVFAEI